MPSSQFTGASQPKQVERLTAPPPAKKSKLPLVLGILAVLFALGVVLSVAAYIVVPKIIPSLQARRSEQPPVTEPQKNPTEAPNAETTPVQQETATPAENVPPSFTPPANAVQFVNSSDKLDGKLAEHYVDFSFYYPDNWQKDPKSGVAGASNFAKVERRLPPDFTQENFAVGWYSSSGSLETDQSLFHSLTESMSSQFEKSFPEYHKVSEGATKVGVYGGYEFRFTSLSRDTAKGDIKLWGRVIFLPPQDGGRSGVTLLMLATSLAPELESVTDVGEKGELPMILESFRFGRATSQ
jgi:flagellar basal body-associated protein FliL